MTTPSEAADPDKDREPEDTTQTTGEGQGSRSARGEDLRDDERSDDEGSVRPDLGQIAEPTNEPDPGGLPDESQGPP
jgi:hypothetical protein